MPKIHNETITVILLNQIFKIIDVQFTVEHFKASTTEAIACAVPTQMNICKSLRLVKVQSQEKKENGTEPGTKLPHICLFQLILLIIAQLFPCKGMQGDLIIEVKLDAFKAGGKK